MRAAWLLVLAAYVCGQVGAQWLPRWRPALMVAAAAFAGTVTAVWCLRWVALQIVGFVVVVHPSDRMYR